TARETASSPCAAAGAARAASGIRRRIAKRERRIGGESSTDLRPGVVRPLGARSAKDPVAVGGTLWAMPPERMTALDASFLYLERPAMHMHVAGVSILDPSTRPDGRLRFEDVASTIAARLHLLPRFRQRAVAVPLDLGLPVWADDERFDLDFPLRRAALPSPGGRRQLADWV